MKNYNQTGYEGVTKAWDIIQREVRVYRLCHISYRVALLPTNNPNNLLWQLKHFL